MTTKSEGANARTTTTEELIVQYLDGELVRKELETVLFDRLSHSEEARALLREYLVVRGAIRKSRADERFQLSSDLDARTRRRVEQMLESIEADGFDIAATDGGGRLADRPAIESSSTGRRLKQWSLRPSLAALALLLAVGTTWFLTRTSLNSSMTKPLAKTNVVNALHPSADMASASNESAGANAAAERIAPANISMAHTTASAKLEVPAPRMNSIAPVSRTRIRRVIASPSLAQNLSPVVHAHPRAAAPKAQPNSADIMISQRYGKAIEAASKHEIVISWRDRL